MPLVILFLLLALTTSAQLVGSDPKTLSLSGSYHRRVVVPDHMVLVLHSPDIQIDTLIMDKKSVLRLEYSSTRLTVGHAFIGKKCLIDGRGEPGIPVASRGRDGKSLDLTILFHKLGRLTVSTSGGQGTIGYPGRAGTPGISGGTGTADGGPGSSGGKGGPGGDGGDLTIHYQGMGFTPVLGKAKKNSLVLNNRGGSGGGGGRGGPGGPGGMPTVTSYVGARGETVREVNGVRGATGRSGITGEAGDMGKDGVLVVEVIR